LSRRARGDAIENALALNTAVVLGTHNGAAVSDLLLPPGYSY